MSKQPPLAPTVSALALLLSKVIGLPGIGSLPSTIAPSDHPLGLVVTNSILSSVKLNSDMISHTTEMNPRDIDQKRVARCYLWLFTLYINIKISKNSC